MDLLLALKALEEVESKMSALYEGYCKWFGKDSEAATLFARMSLDETAHSNIIRYELSRAFQNRRIFDEVNVDLEEIQGLSSLLDRVCNSPAVPSLEEAIQLALEFENQAVEKHGITALLNQSHPQLKRLLNSIRGLGAADREHGNLLAEFAKQRGFL